MGSSPDTSPAVSPGFLAVFHAHAAADGTMPFARFMELALYHPEVGYYRRDRPRVGRGPGTDFYTASSSGTVFGELVVHAAAALLRQHGRDPAVHTLIEIGAEPGAGVFTGLALPFRSHRAIRVGEAIDLTGDCVVFSNELFDAQPCVRTVRRADGWREIHVQAAAEGFVEVERPAEFFEAAPEGYRFDRPLAAAALAGRIAAQPWRGLFLALDYGKTARELLENTPGGTARAYLRHRQSADLLARPGEQDLTCHVCWDWIAGALTDAGFTAPAIEFQESFFVRRAAGWLATAVAADAAQLTRRKLALMQLLHPGQMGQKFQALHAVR